MLLAQLPVQRSAPAFDMAVAFVVAVLALDFVLVHAKPAQPEKALDEIVGARRAPAATRASAPADAHATR